MSQIRADGQAYEYEVLVEVVRAVGSWAKVRVWGMLGNGGSLNVIGFRDHQIGCTVSK